MRKSKHKNLIRCICCLIMLVMALSMIPSKITKASDFLIGNKIVLNAEASENESTSENLTSEDKNETESESETETEPETESKAKPKLSETKLTLGAGMTYQLKLVSEDESISVLKWTSSDVKMVSVGSDGTLTGKRVGKATITAVLSDDSKLKCVVTVPEVTISETLLETAVGKKKILTVSGTDAEPLWSVVNEEIAEVSVKGKVTAKKYGSTYVKAKVGYVTVKCKVKVYDPTFSQNEFILMGEDVKALKLKKYSGSVTWKSSDKSVATVSSTGIVTTHAPGVATITAKANGVKVTCQITCINAALYVSEVRVEEGTKKILNFACYSDLVIPTWSSSNEEVAEVSEKGKITAKKSGEATITVKVGDSSRSCYVIVDQKGANNIFVKKPYTTYLDIYSIRDYALGWNFPYRVLQGVCTDGKYLYFTLSNPNTNVDCAIVKMRISDKKIIKTKTNLNLNHCNDITYNADKKMLVVAHSGSNPNQVSYLSPQTLKVKKTITLDNSIGNIAYCSAKKCYVTESRGSHEIQIRNKNFKIKKSFTFLSKRTYTRQGIDCDKNYIYIPQSTVGGYDNRILIYDWDGNYITTINYKSYYEIESICHIGNRFYVGYNNDCYSGGCLDQTAIKPYFTLLYSAGKGSGKMKPGTYAIGQEIKLRKCNFTRKNFSFRGWTLKRSSDGYVYCINKSTKKKGWYSEESMPKGYKIYLLKSGKSIENACKKAGDTITATAKWKKIKKSKKKK